MTFNFHLILLCGAMAAMGIPLIYAQEVSNSSGGTHCKDVKHAFDPLRHKPVYYIGVENVNGDIEELQATFETYLSESAGQQFDQPIEFKIISSDMEGMFREIDKDKIDFIFVSPGLYSCIGIEHGAQPLASVIRRKHLRGKEVELDVYGGVMFTRVDNKEINYISDLKDKVIAAGSLSAMMVGQLQFHEMADNGLSYVMDPKQVVFTDKQVDIAEGVLNGDFDVGFVRTDQLEHFGLTLDDVKVLNPRSYVMDNGDLFPFLTSTAVFPEWPVAALPHVPPVIAIEVQEALIAMQVHAETGRQISTGAAYAPMRCDTTEDLAIFALEASEEGNIAAFRNPKSYFGVRTMQEAAGFLKKDEDGNWKCTRHVLGELFASIDCPEGHFRVDADEFKDQCAKAGLPCKEGYDCFCRPCIKAHDVDVFECYHPDDYIHENRHIGCTKMHVCGSTEQQNDIQFRARDNILRKDTELRVKVHTGDVVENIPVTIVDDYRFKFNFTGIRVGTSIMEVEIDGVQISQSPFQVEVVPRDCDVPYPGQNRVPDSLGDCVCGNNTIEINGKCVSATIIAVSASVAFLIIAFIAGIFFLRWKNHKNDQAWLVSPEELHFDEPAEVIGQGSFGVVLKAEYRGTAVAIKKAIKYSSRRGSVASRRSGSKSAQRSRKNNCAETASSGSADVVSVDSSDTAEADVENGIKSGSASASGMNASMSMSALFGGFNQESKWAFWRKGNNADSTFKDSILGGSQSLTKKPWHAIIFPWCNAAARREEAFVSEMRVLSRLRHPCITTVMGAVVSNRHEPMLVMEFMEYGSLNDVLKNDTMVLAGDVILQMCRDVAQGLRYLHSSKPPVMHHDMKAKNILIDSRFRAKLCDFGLSDGKINVITGTPFWMAPEYLTGKTKQYTCACDIYSFGIILWEIYSRKSPFEGENVRKVLRDVCDRRRNKRPEIAKTFPPKMVQLMTKCWSADPGQRPIAANLDMTLMEFSARDAEPLKTDLEMNRNRGEKLYDELFPAHIAAALKAGQKVEPETHEIVTVIFSHIVDFAEISTRITPEKICSLLDRLFKVFDDLTKKHGVFKVETVGDNYMGVTNLDGNHLKNHVKSVAELAIDMINEANKILVDEDMPEKGTVSLRVGFHSGSVVSNVIGSLNPRYGLFGDTVNTASRMESNSQANKILCSEYSHSLLEDQAPDLPTKKRGKIQVKGKGQMSVYWVGVGLIASSAPPSHGRKVSFDADNDDSVHSVPEAPMPEEAPKKSSKPTKKEQQHGSLSKAKSRRVSPAPTRRHKK